MKTNEGATKSNKIINICSAAGIFLAFMTLSSLVFSLFSPIIKTNAADSDTVNVSATINGVLSVSAPETVALSSSSVTPTTDGVFVSNSGTVTVTTNSLTGYYLYISSTQATMSSSSASTTIGACASGVTSSTMVKDTWGYSIDSGATYKPITTSNTLIKTSDSVSDTTQTVYFGAKISTATESGTYTNTATFTGVTK